MNRECYLTKETRDIKMGKKKRAEIEIAWRCAEFVAALSPQIKEACLLVGISKRRYYDWKNGECSPSAYCLQALVARGADANYLLTGKVKHNNGKTNH